jgi:hypothetical protein
MLPAGLYIAAPASRPAALPGIGSLSFNDVLNTIGTAVRDRARGHGAAHHSAEG